MSVCACADPFGSPILICWLVVILDQVPTITSRREATTHVARAFFVLCERRVTEFTPRRMGLYGFGIQREITHVVTRQGEGGRGEKSRMRSDRSKPRVTEAAFAQWLQLRKEKEIVATASKLQGASMDTSRAGEDCERKRQKHKSHRDMYLSYLLSCLHIACVYVFVYLCIYLPCLSVFLPCLFFLSFHIWFSSVCVCSCVRYVIRSLLILLSHYLRFVVLLFPSFFTSVFCLLFIFVLLLVGFFLHADIRATLHFFYPSICLSIYLPIDLSNYLALSTFVFSFSRSLSIHLTS